MNPPLAIVTGASSGIGLALTLSLLEHGYLVVANARSIESSGALPDHPRLRLVDGDVGDPETGARLARVAVEFGGGIDLLVNNAGIFVPKPFEDYTAEEYDRVTRTNSEGFFFVSQAAVRVMEGRGGHIVNLSTTLADQPVAGVSALLTQLTKGGINSATKALAIELAGRGIRVNAIGAGIIDTPMHDPAAHDFLSSLHPLHRLGTVQEIVDAVHYLQEASFVTGEILHVDGGAHAGKW